MFEDLNQIISSDYENIVGLIVCKDGHRLYENSFGDFALDEAIHITSVTKSIISLLMGIAIDKGYIESVNQKVLDFFPDYTLKRGEKTIQGMTIKHIMTMTAPYKFKSEPYTKVYSSEDWTKATLDLLGGRGSVGEFKYTTVGTHILSGIIATATGRSLLDFSMEHLFEPLGIDRPSAKVITNRADYMSFIKYKGDNLWISDPGGSYTAGWGMALSVEDLVKIGQLVLNKGIFNGKQLLSPEWLSESTSVHSHWGDLAYGFMWWIIDEDSYAAIGDGGNVIYIHAKMNLVVAMTSTFKPRYKDRIMFIQDHILSQL